MKKIDKSISKEYLPVNLYLDDLENIHGILREVSDSVSIETDEYKFDTIEEVASNRKGDRIKELHLKTTTNPHVTLGFTPLWARIYVSSSEANGAGIFYKLNQVIEKRTRTLKWLYSFYVPFIVGGIMLLSSRFLPSLTYSSSPFYVSLAVSVTALLFMWVIWITYVRLRKHSTIALIHRSTEKSFLQRNKDNLILVIISALLGAILGVAGTLIVNKYQDRPSNQVEGSTR